MATVLHPPAVVLARAPSPPGAEHGFSRAASSSEILTLVRSSGLAAAAGPLLVPAASSSSIHAAAAPQPHALRKSESEPVPPAPARPKRVRCVSATIDLGAVSIPTTRQIAPEGGGTPYTIYDIRVKPLTGRSGWDVHRRYSNFAQLHETLLHAYPHAHPPPPPLPPKRWLGSQSPRFIEKRRAALEAYLEGLLANEALRKSKEVRIFLGLNSAFGVGVGLLRGGSSSSLLAALASEAGGARQPIDVPSSSSSSTATTAAADGAPTASSSSPSSCAAAAATTPESALFSFPYAGGSFVGEGAGKKLGGLKGKGKGKLQQHKATKPAAVPAVGAVGERDAWTDLVAVTTSLADKQPPLQGWGDEKQDGKQLEQQGKGPEPSVAAPSAPVVPRAVCSIM